MESSEHYNKNWICGEQWTLQQKLDLWRAANVTTEVGFVESSNIYDYNELELWKAVNIISKKSRSCGELWKAVDFYSTNWRSCETQYITKEQELWKAVNIYIVTKCQSFEEHTAVKEEFVLSQHLCGRRKHISLYFWCMLVFHTNLLKKYTFFP